MPLELHRTPPPAPPGPDVFLPFTDIAISMSGGGFRSAAYGLGCLAYLQRRKYNGLTLLERVKFIVAASGGAMTGILFSAYNHMGIPFKTTYDHLRNNIFSGDKILREAARIVRDDDAWKNDPTKNRNTINAFAKAYQNLAFDDLTFDVYTHNEKRTLEQVCFNASELENGRAFRFETDGWDTTNEILGNRYLRVKDNNSAAVKKLRLGDIMAASSCFPAGFEPMVFPDDFAENEEHQAQLQAEMEIAKNYDWETYIPFTGSVALMDGGITDNQGIEGLKLANDRRLAAHGRGYDLNLICDVANYFMDPFEPLKEERSWWSGITLMTIINAHKYAYVIFGISLVMILTNVLTDVAWIMATVSAIMFALFLFVRYVFLRKPISVAASTGDAKPRIKESMWDLPVSLFLDFFLQNPLSKTEMMLKVRIRSALRVAMEIYLLQIRRINYDSLYTNPEWAYKTKAVSIYELSKSNENVLQRQFERKKFDAAKTKLLTPSAAVMNVAETARQMGTTLWFPDMDKSSEINVRDALIACGQFTMCYNLLEYILQIEEYYPEVLHDAGFQQLKKEILDDWATFQKSPEFMIEDFDKVVE
jgi:predicted acylesterase/phospholipase RssA